MDEERDEETVATGFDAVPPGAVLQLARPFGGAMAIFNRLWLDSTDGLWQVGAGPHSLAALPAALFHCSHRIPELGQIIV